MFGWLGQKFQHWAADKQRDEMQRFVTSLRGQTAEELGVVVLMATIVRLTVEERTLPPTLLEGLSHTEADLYAPLHIGRLIKDLQKQGSMPQAAGAMVWLHSVRAILTPELRLLGREMWAELKRGFEHVSTARIDLMLLTERPVDSRFASEALYTPTPLLPLVK